MKILSILTLLFLPISAFAGESGVIWKGKKIVLHKDGEKVGELPKELEKQIRSPASTLRTRNGEVHLRGEYANYTEFDEIICISIESQSGTTRTANVSISCVKK